jgi:hypothetical protein
MEYSLSILDQAPTKRREPFLWRQFAPTRTPAQLAFDLIFGVAGPILCFLADPLVFRPGLMGAPLLGRFQLFAYVLSTIAISVLIVWCFLAEYIDAFRAMISGVLVAGAAFSLVIGVVILPFSLIGVLLIIGLAGFTPFLTAFVYIRNGFRAFPGRTSRHSRESTWTMGVLGGLVALALAGVISIQVSSAISRSLSALLHGNPQQAEVAAAQMRWMALLPRESFDEIVEAYQVEQDPKRKALLKKFYQDMTGQDIDRRLRILND